METLTPELERRLQIEELWARRLVLCDPINQHRLDRYQARRALLCLNGTETSLVRDVPQPESVDQLPSAAVPVSDQAPQRAARSALVQGLCGALAAALIVGAAMIQDPQNSLIRAQNFLQTLVHSWGSASQTRAEDQADISEDDAEAPPSFPDLHREVSQKLHHR